MSITAGNVGIGTTSPTEKLEVSGNILASGTITEGSSREYKKDITSVSTEEAMDALRGLKPVKFKYKLDVTNEEHLGFIAEDVPELVATKDRKDLSPMDVTAVLTKVVQEEQQREMDSMKKEMETLKQLLLEQ